MRLASHHTISMVAARRRARRGKPTGASVSRSGCWSAGGGVFRLREPLVNVHAFGDITAALAPAPKKRPGLCVAACRNRPHFPQACLVAVVDVDGILLDSDATGLGSLGENPVAVFRERLDAIECNRRVRAVVLRIHSPGGSVTATDIMWRDLAAFKCRTHLPVVACLMDVAAGGGYYLATGADCIVAHPTTVTGGDRLHSQRLQPAGHDGPVQYRRHPDQGGQKRRLGLARQGDRSGRPEAACRTWPTNSINGFAMSS